MTIVTDLAAGTIQGLGAAPMDHLATETPLSTGHAAKYKYANISATVSGTGRLTCTAAASTDINGTYLYFEDNWATVTRMDVIRPLVVSNFFSGCAFKVYRGGGAYFAAHIARPGGASSDANVTLLDDYGAQNGWVEVQHVPSAGVVTAHPGATTVAMVSELHGNQIRTVRLALNGQGVAVNTQLFTSPA